VLARTSPRKSKRHDGVEMNVTESDSACKSTTNNGSSPHSAKRTTDRFIKYAVWCSQSDWHVRIPYTFIVTWGHILHPLTFLLWCILKMQAKFQDGPLKNHTNGDIRFKHLTELTGASKVSVRRGLRELEYYGLIFVKERAEGYRGEHHRAVDFWLDPDAKPPAEQLALTDQHLRARRPYVDTPTRVTNEPAAGHKVTRQGSQSDPPRVTNEPAEGHKVTLPYKDSSCSTPPANSSPSSTPPAPPKPPARVVTTAAVPTLPDLTPLQTIGPLCIDDRLAHQLFLDCQAAAPGVTVLEIHACMSAHVHLATRPTVTNPRKFLCVTVVSALRGPWLARYRSEQAAAAADLATLKRRMESEQTAWTAYERGEGPSPWTGRMKPAAAESQ